MKLVKHYHGKVYATFIQVPKPDLKTLIELKKHGWEIARQAG